jgi:MFS family permease
MQMPGEATGSTLTLQHDGAALRDGHRRDARAIFSAPGAVALFATSIIARLPLAMVGLALLIHTQRLTGSFATAGVVTGAYAIALGVGAPLLGQIVDRFGQTVVLLGSALMSSLLLEVVALLPPSVPAPMLIAPAAAIGLATPPVAACVRTLLPDVLHDAESLPAAYALESTVLELTFIVGPPIALGLGAIWSTRAALACTGLVLLAASVAFAAQPASRRWRPIPGVPRIPGGALRSPAMQTLILILVAVGVVFGSVDVGVAAAAKDLGSTVSAGPLLAMWGAGSLLGGAVSTRLGGVRGAGGLTMVLIALTLAHAALGLATASLPAMAAVLLVAGATIAPTYATIYAMVDDAAPAGTLTEAFAWLLAAVSIGTAAGSAVAGGLAQGAGPGAVFTFAAGAGVLAVLVTAVGSHTLGAAGRRTPAVLFDDCVPS